MQKLIPNNAVLIPDEADRVFRGNIFDVYQWHQQLFDGSYDTFEMLRRSDTVHVIAMIENRFIVLEEEQPHRGRRVSLPGGRVDEGDSSIFAAAQRELREETGYTLHDWRLISVRQPVKKIEWFVYLYIAAGVCTKEEVHLDAGEKIVTRLETFDSFRQMIMRNDTLVGSDRTLLEQIMSSEDLWKLPEFVGTDVDR